MSAEGDSRRMKRRRATISIEKLLSADAGLARADAIWRADGYAVSGGRMWRRNDGTWTARIVWRNRDAVVSTVVYTVQGLVLS